jgi:Reverse transcriptase (RNA-dependent DNA polymerase)
MIADANGLKTLCSDIGNAFVNSYTNEKIYTRAGPEFGPTLQGKTMLIVKSLYGLQSSAERWRAHFASTLQSLGFVSSRADQDVWLIQRDDGSGYDYICTHVDDFSIFAKDPDIYMSVIKDLYVVRDIGPPKYYLGNDFFRGSTRKAYMGSSTYVTEAVRKVEEKLGVLWKERSPCVEGDHPELDTSSFLDADDTRLFQNLIGVAQWIAQLGRFDIAQAINSLSRFSAAPRQGHLDHAIRIFAYLKRRKHMAICIDSRPPLIDHGSVHSCGEPDLSTIYPDACEDLDPKLPVPLGPELEITGVMDSDHAHDHMTRRSVSGILLFVGRTPVMAFSKRQGAVQASTYGAEFVVARTTIEEILSLRYFLRSFGVPVTRASRVFGDNMSVLISMTQPDSQLKKKHLCLAYHILRENVACNVVQPFYIPSRQNYADFLTKGLVVHNYHTNGLLYDIPPGKWMPF